MAKQTVAIYVTDEVLERVELICERTGESRSVCMERLVRLGTDVVEGRIHELDSPLLGKLLRLLFDSPGLMKLLGTDLKSDEFAAMRKRLERIRETRGTKGAKKGA